MIKQTITYTDFNDEERTEDFWFHLDKADLLELQAMRKGGMRAYMLEIVQSDNNEEILNIFKMFILRSIGKRSEDGRQFIRNDEIRDEFRQTNAYSEFLFTLGNNAELGAEFIQGIMPANLEKDLAKHGIKPTTNVELPADTSTNDAEAKEKVTERRYLNEFTPEEIRLMSDDLFNELRKRTKADRLSPAQLQASFSRASQ